jgi:hypothetical protein
MGGSVWRRCPFATPPSTRALCQRLILGALKRSVANIHLDNLQQVLYILFREYEFAPMGLCETWSVARWTKYRVAHISLSVSFRFSGY